MSSSPQVCQAFYSYLKFPYYELVREFKNNKKQLEKEASSIMKDIIEARSKKFEDSSAAVAYFGRLKDRLKAIKDTLAQNQKREDSLLEVLSKRVSKIAKIEHLDPSNDGQADIDGAQDLLIDILLKDYLNKYPSSELANNLRQTQSAGQADNPQASVVDAASQGESASIREEEFEQHFHSQNAQVEEDLKNHSLGSALAWCGTHRSKLQKLRSPFEFRLRVLEFVQTVLSKDPRAAMHYVQDNLREVEPEQVKELKHVSRALVYGSRIANMPEFAHFFSEQYWAELLAMFKDMRFQVQGLTSRTTLEILMGAGLTALKTPFCKPASGSSNFCPVCNETIYKLAKPLPYSTKSSSHLICRILGVVMDENNPPVVLPNNQVYSTKGIEKISKPIVGSTDRTVVCPVTMSVFKTSQIQKIYLTS